MATKSFNPHNVTFAIGGVDINDIVVDDIAIEYNIDHKGRASVNIWPDKDEFGTPFDHDFWFDPWYREGETKKRTCAYCRDLCEKKYATRKIFETIMVNTKQVYIPKGKHFFHERCYKRLQKDGMKYISTFIADLEKM